MAPTLRKRVVSSANPPADTKLKSTKAVAKKPKLTAKEAKLVAAEKKGTVKEPKGKGGKKKDANMGSESSSPGIDNSDDSWKNAKSVYDFSVKTISGEEVSLEKYKGHVLLIVNVASKCGYTSKNYKELIELDEQFRESKGLRILAFPCNQFGGQEPGDSEAIQCSIDKRGVKFDVFEKINVNGPDAHPLYKYLKYKQSGTLIDAIKWNFTKFIVDKNGQPVERYSSNKNPLSILSDLEKYW